MVASGGSVEDASQDSIHYSEEWTPVTRKRFIKKNKKVGNKKFENYKFPNRTVRVNNNAMKVLVGSVDNFQTNTKKDMGAPHKPQRVEALRSKKLKCQKKTVPVTSKKFSNKKFEQIMLTGLQEVQAYYKIPNVSRSLKTLQVDLKSTIEYVEKQLELIHMLLDHKIKRLPRDIRPYAELHYKKAIEGTLPRSVVENPLNFFRMFHHLGRQWQIASNYRRYLYELT
jgi:hypothetical protein